MGSWRAAGCSSLMFIFLISVCANADRNRAFFIFGDSTVDVGNNNYFQTFPPFRANFPPYGREFFGKPTGRFGEGRLIVDFIAGYAGLPLVPPYGDREADFSRGANFASGGGGVLSETNQGLAIDLKSQLLNFVELKRSLVEIFGPLKAKQIFADAVYLISIGSNDYMGGYLGNLTMQEKFQPDSYVGMVVENLIDAIEILYSNGARKMAYLGLGPLGCLPALRAAAQDPKGGCLEAASALGQAHNIDLFAALKHLRTKLSDLNVGFYGFFEFLRERLENPAAHGFKEAFTACCGSGPYGGASNCGVENEAYQLCTNSSEYIWWDSYHPTEPVHEQFAKAVWNGSAELSSLSVRQLFHSSSSSLSPLCEEETERSQAFFSNDVSAQLQFSTK